MATRRVAYSHNTWYHFWGPLHRENLALEVGRGMKGADVVEVLDRLVEERGGVVPKNGTRCYESMRRDALPYMR